MIKKYKMNYNVTVLSQNELDWLEFSKIEISKFIKPDKSVTILDATVIVGDDLRKVNSNISDNVKGIEKIMVVVSAVMLDETPVIPRRLWKLALVCELSFLSKFNYDDNNIEGQSSKCIDNSQLSNRLLSIKHSFMKSITKKIDDMKVTSYFNKFIVRSLCVKQM